MQYTSTRTTNRAGIGQSQGISIAGGILIDRPQRWNANTLGIEAAHHMTRPFGRDHCHVNICWWHNLSKVQAETMSYEQQFARSQTRLDIPLKDCTMPLIGDQDHDYICLLSR